MAASLFGKFPLQWMKRFLLTLVTVMLLSMELPAQLPQTDSSKPDDVRIAKSDGCSMFSDGDYGECCVAHDREYQLGGTSADRKAADEQLYRCVRAKGHKYLSGVMWAGVRLLGFGYFKWSRSRVPKEVPVITTDRR